MEEIKTEEIFEEPSKEEKKAKKASKKDTEKELLEEIERLRAELSEKDDKYLRMAAEYVLRFLVFHRSYSGDVLLLHQLR